MMHACMVARRAATRHSAPFISAPDPKAGMAAMLPVSNGGSCCRLHRTRGAAMKSPPTHPPSVTGHHPLLPYLLSRSSRHLTPECAPDCLTLRLQIFLCVRYERRATLLESEQAALNVCGLANGCLAGLHVVRQPSIKPCSKRSMSMLCFGKVQRRSVEIQPCSANSTGVHGCEMRNVAGHVSRAFRSSLGTKNLVVSRLAEAGSGKGASAPWPVAAPALQPQRPSVGSDRFPPGPRCLRHLRQAACAPARPRPPPSLEAACPHCEYWREPDRLARQGGRSWGILL